eukprot:g795.t1
MTDAGEELLKIHRARARGRTLPQVAGIYSLTKSEIKRDLRSIEAAMPKEVHNLPELMEEPEYPPLQKRAVTTAESTPAAKRKRMKRWQANPGEAQNEIREYKLTVEQAKHELQLAETQRSDLEAKFMSLRQHYVATINMIEQEKKESQCTLQVLHNYANRQALDLHLDEQASSTMHAILVELQNRGIACERLKQEKLALEAKLEQALQSQQKDGGDGMQGVEATEAMELEQAQAERQRKILDLVRGQLIRTYFGLARVKTLKNEISTTKHQNRDLLRQQRELRKSYTSVLSTLNETRVHNHYLATSVHEGAVPLVAGGRPAASTRSGKSQLPPRPSNAAGCGNSGGAGSTKGGGKSKLAKSKAANVHAAPLRNQSPRKASQVAAERISSGSSSGGGAAASSSSNNNSSNSNGSNRATPPPPPQSKGQKEKEKQREKEKEQERERDERAAGRGEGGSKGKGKGKGQKRDRSGSEGRDSASTNGSAAGGGGGRGKDKDKDKDKDEMDVDDDGGQDGGGGGSDDASMGEDDEFRKSAAANKSKRMISELAGLGLPGMGLDLDGGKMTRRQRAELAAAMESTRESAGSSRRRR